MRFTKDNAAEFGRRSARRAGESKSPEKAAAARLNGQLARARELAGRHPFLRRPEWTPAEIVMAGRRLKRLPPEEQAHAAAFLDQDGIPPRKALDILRRLTRRPAAEREDIYALAGSVDRHDRKIALTRAAALPPPPDPGLVRLREAERAIRLAAQVTRVRRLRSEIEALLPGIAHVAERVKKEQPI